MTNIEVGDKKHQSSGKRERGGINGLRPFGPSEGLYGEVGSRKGSTRKDGLTAQTGKSAKMLIVGEKRGGVWFIGENRF